MTQHTPVEPVPDIACTLSRDQLGDRRGEWHQLDRHIQSQVRTADGFRVVFAASDDVRSSLPELVAAEAECCAFAEWRLDVEDDVVVLDVRAPRDAVDGLAEAFGIPTGPGQADSA